MHLIKLSIETISCLLMLATSTLVFASSETSPRNHQELLRDQVSVSEDAVYSFTSRLKSGEATPMEHADFKAKVVDFEARAIQALKDYEQEMRNEILPIVQLHLDHYNSIATDQDTYSLEQKKRLLKEVMNDSAMQEAALQRRRLLFRTLTAVVPLPIAVSYSQVKLRDACEFYDLPPNCGYDKSILFTQGIYDGHRTHIATQHFYVRDRLEDKDRYSYATQALAALLQSLYAESIGKDCYSRSCYILSSQYIGEWVNLIETKLNVDLNFTAEKVLESNQDPVVFALKKNANLETTRRVGSLAGYTVNNSLSTLLWQKIKGFKSLPLGFSSDGSDPVVIPLSQTPQIFRPWWVRAFVDDDALSHIDSHDEQKRSLMSTLLVDFLPPRDLPFDLSQTELEEILTQKEAEKKAAEEEQAKLKAEAEALNTQRNEKIDAMAIEIANLFSKDKGVHKLRPKKQRQVCLERQYKWATAIAEVGEDANNPYFEASSLSKGEIAAIEIRARSELKTHSDYGKRRLQRALTRLSLCIKNQTRPKHQLRRRSRRQRATRCRL